MFNYLRDRRRASAEMAELERRARACGVERWTVNGVVERLEELCMEVAAQKAVLWSKSASDRSASG